MIILGNTPLLTHEGAEPINRAYKFVGELINSGRITVPHPLRRIMKLEEGDLLEIVIRHVPEKAPTGNSYEELEPPEVTELE